MNPDCPLCRRDHLNREPVQPLVYEDEVCWVTYLNVPMHPNVPLIVLKRHDAEPTDAEKRHLVQVGKDLFLWSAWRGPGSVPGHFHLHAEIEF